MVSNSFCDRCQQVSLLEPSRKKVYFIFPIPVLREKMKLILSKMEIEFAQQNELLEVKVSNFKEFVSDLSSKGGLSHPETNDILCIVLDEEEDFSFASYSKIRPLSKWFSIIQYEDYIRIIQNKSLVIYFHPIIDAKTLKIYGYECLVRGLTPSGELIPPLVLFDFAEKTDNLFYLDRACREVAVSTASRKKLENYKIFINFIPTSIYDPESCLQTTIQAAKVYNFNPANLVFEVVESQKVTDLNHLSNIISYYRRHGYMVALDDMGTGYASIEMLINLKPDLVKIDRQIINDIHKDSVKQSVFRGIVKICEETDILKIAEGIEKEEEFKFVKDYVDLVQGYLFSKPDENPITDEELAKKVQNLT